MLEKLFGSKLRVKLLRLFLNHPEKTFDIKELSRKMKIKAAKIRSVLNDLSDLELITKTKIQKPDPLEKSKIKKDPKKTEQFAINSCSMLYPELCALFLKSDILFERDLISRLSRLGSVFYLALAGRLVGAKQTQVDLFIVGRINRRRLRQLIKTFEKELDREINYSIMSRREFDYRKSITDRFLYNILEGRRIVIVNKLKI